MFKKLLFALCAVSFAANAQNNYLDFDGTNDVVETPNATATVLANATNISMSCKVYPTRVSSGFPDFDGILGFRNETDFDFYLIQLSTTDVEARFRNSAGAAFSITYTGLQLNQWTQFFLVYDGSMLRLYAGAIEVGAVTASGVVAAAPSGYLSIGRIQFQAFNWHHQGYIDEVSLWNKALLPTDIAAIVANSGEILNPTSETNLKAYYKMNQGIPYGNNIGLTTVNDELGFNNGIAANFAMTGPSSNWGSQNLATGNFNRDHVAIYPNPASDYISISGLTNESIVTILDIAGRVISVKKTKSDTAIDVSDLTSGVYFLSVNDNQKIRFIKS